MFVKGSFFLINSENFIQCYNFVAVHYLNFCYKNKSGNQIFVRILFQKKKRKILKQKTFSGTIKLKNLS